MTIENNIFNIEHYMFQCNRDMMEQMEQKTRVCVGINVPLNT